MFLNCIFRSFCLRLNKLFSRETSCTPSQCHWQFSLSLLWERRKTGFLLRFQYPTYIPKYRCKREHQICQCKCYVNVNQLLMNHMHSIYYSEGFSNSKISIYISIMIIYSMNGNESSLFTCNWIQIFHLDRDSVNKQTILIVILLSE